MHHNNFGNFYTLEIYAIPIPIGFISIPIMSRMAIPIPMGLGFPWGFPLPCTPLVDSLFSVMMLLVWCVLCCVLLYQWHLWSDCNSMLLCIVLFTALFHRCVALPTLFCWNTKRSVFLWQKCQILNNTSCDKIICYCEINARLMAKLSVTSRLENYAKFEE